MKSILNTSLFTALLMLIGGSLLAQNEPIVITGTVLDYQSQSPIEFATIMLGSSQDNSVITGTTTDEDGTFTISSDTENVFLEISFIGYVSQKITDFEVQSNRVDVGTLFLSENSQTLDEVVVRAEKSQTEFKLDRRVFNVGQDLSSTGASALELLNNVPSVNVNIEGEISLRGSGGVQILINGKPSVLADEGGALGSITADMIDRIEVITNPSAKYDAEGSSGILNIVLKKEEKKGVNGSVSVNTGIPDNHSVGLSLNRRTEKFNLFSQIGAGYRELPRDNNTINQDLLTGTTILSTGTDYRNEAFYNVILGADYHINPLNVLTLSGNFAYEVEEQPSLTNFRQLGGDDLLVSEWYREENTEATNPKWQYELQYKKDFEDNEDHTLLFSALGNFFGKDQSSEFENATITGSEAPSNQQTETSFSETKYTFQLDYTKPFSDKVTLEVGSQYVITDVANDYAVSNLVNNEWIQDAGLTNIFEFDQKVLGVYSTGAYEGERWGVKAGLRLEMTDLSTLLTNTSEDNQQNYANLFPSLHTSYKVTKRFSLQAGYSKRIFRPRLWDLNPFFNIRNNFSIRTGNPNLNPEFTDSYEINSIYIFEKVSLNLGIYQRYTTDVVERVSTFENNVNTFKPLNIGTNRATGVELNGKYSPNKWLTFNGDFNYNYFNREGVFEDNSFDFSADQWSSKLTTKIKFPAAIDFEVTGQYRSQYQTVQQTVSDNFFIDLGIRKKIMNGKTILNLSVRDVFASRNRESEILQDDFYIYNFGQRGRFITLGLSYGFGKGEAMEYSGGRRR
ncbi:outer membrane beta-barrel family protein [Lewinella cohaerens]|uniref:outer membrane beta-barrel family protein n=1 Tax=Lewinella cohaerens TaxID=70995 RepID=UPI00037BFEA0|nr:outer membrane beta-barrel family protein [Lewinella cohaerens]